MTSLSKCLMLPIGYLAIVATTANAEMLFQDNFQSDLAGTTPTTDDLDPAIGTGDVGGYWTISEYAPDFVQVLNDAPINSGQAGTNNYLYAKRDTGIAGIPWATGWDVEQTRNQLLKFTCSLYVPASNLNYAAFAAFNSAPGSYTNRNFAVYFWQDDTVRYYDGAFKLTGLTYTPDHWMDIAVVTDLASQTYDLYVDGNWVADLTCQSVATAIQAVGFFNTDDSRLYADNVSLSIIPEPSCLALLLLGAFGLAITRRRILFSPRS